MSGKWFTNRGQMLQVALSAAALIVTVWSQGHRVFSLPISSASALFVLLTLAVIVSIWVMATSPTLSQPDRETKRLATAEFEGLSASEKLALRLYLQDRRATDEQVWQRLEAQGFPGPRVNMWAVLNKKTRFMDRDFVGANGIKPEFQPLVAKLLRRAD